MVIRITVTSDPTKAGFRPSFVSGNTLNTSTKNSTRVRKLAMELACWATEGEKGKNPETALKLHKGLLRHYAEHKEPSKT